jgi:hypothetical protein
VHRDRYIQYKYNLSIVSAEHLILLSEGLHVDSSNV